MVAAAAHAANLPLDRFSLVCDVDSHTAVTVASLDDRDASDGITAGDAVHVRLEDCGGATSDLDLQVEAIDVLDNSVTGLWGNVSFSIVPSAENADAAIARYTGSFALAYKNTGEDTALTIEEVQASKSIDGLTERLESGLLQEQFIEMDYSVRFDGRLQSDTLDGSFEFETATPFAGTSGGFPTAGELTLATADSRARIAPSANADLDEHADYQVDADGNGQYSDAVSVRWLDWMSGSLFRWYPLVRGLTILPRDPGTNHVLRADFSLSPTRRGLYSIAYEWRVNGSLQAGQTAYTLPSRVTAKGDIIEVRITVSHADAAESRQASVTVRNIPPDVQASLSPDKPDTRDDIALNWRVSDSDGDQVETTVQWTVNGSVVAGLGSATLPSGRHRKNDVIRAIVTATDGEAQTTRELGLTIQDANPTVGIDALAGSANHGELIAFDATVSDADGDDVDSFRFKLDYGPVGMSVDPVTGRVEWDVSVPMFDGTMDVRWQIGSSSGPAEAVTGTLRVVDPDRRYPFMLSGSNAPQRDGIRIADLDGDGTDELLALNGIGHVSEFGWDGESLRESWAHPFALNAHSGIDALTSGDIDGDGRQELFLLGRDFVGEHTLVRLDGKQRRAGAQASVPPIKGSGNRIEFADIGHDGSFELIYLAATGPHFQTSIVVLSAHDLTLHWQSPPGYFGSYLRVGDVDHDRALEIVVSGGHVFDGITFEREWSHPSAYSSENSPGDADERNLLVGDLDGDGIDEIAGRFDHQDREAGAEIYSVADSKAIGVAGPLPDSLFDFPAAFPLLVDVDHDGKYEILGIEPREVDVSAYRYDASSDEFVQFLSEETNTVFGAPLAVGDIDGDGASEIILAGQREDGYGNPTKAGRLIVAGFNPAFDVESTGSNTRVFQGGFAGGVPVRDETMLPRGLLFALWGGASDHSDGPRAIFFSPTSGEYTIGPRVDVAGPDVSPPVDRSILTGSQIVDYDADGIHELLGSMGHGNERFVAFDPFREVVEWSSDALHGALVTAADLNGDGFDDFLTRWTGHDMVNDHLVWEPQPPYPDGNTIHTTAGDLDGDGAAEIVAIESPFRDVVAVYTPTGSTATHTRSTLANALSHGSDHVADVAVSDTDGDGRAEIILLTGALRQIRRFGPDHDLLNSFSVESDTVHEEPDRLFVVPGSGGQAQLLVAYFHESLARTSRLVAYDPQTGHEIWKSPRLFGRVLPHSVHYFDESGEPRLAIGTSDAMYVTR